MAGSSSNTGSRADPDSGGPYVTLVNGTSHAGGAFVDHRVICIKESRD